LLEFRRNEILSSVMDDVIGWSKVCINPAQLQCVPSGLGGHIFQESGGLECGCGINDMENRFAVNIHDIDDDLEVEFKVVFQREFESTRCFAVHLALVAVFSEVFDHLGFDFMTCSL
jgi:hypothetical protein